MKPEDHTLSPGCWCDPVVAHVQDGQLLVNSDYDRERLEAMGVQDAVVRPDKEREANMGGDHGSPMPGGK